MLNNYIWYGMAGTKKKKKKEKFLLKLLFKMGYKDIKCNWLYS